MRAILSMMTLRPPARLSAIWLGALLVPATPPASAQVSLGLLQNWGLEVQAAIDATLRVPGTALYAETASLDGTRSGGFRGRAYVWPMSTQFRVLNSLVQLDPASHTASLRQFSDQLHAAYWNQGYRSGTGGGDRFYDDNAHLAVALAEAYTLTGDSVYLDRARATYSFVLEGEDSAAGGGIYFKQHLFTSKDAVSTLQGARSAAMLYQITGEQRYLDDATRLVSWANSRIQQPDGLFNQGFVIETNSPGGVPIVNSAGVGVSANLELYKATDNAAYLTEAKRIASRTLTRYFDAATGRINDEGYWAFELVDALNDLYLIDRNPLWRNRVHTGLAWLHNNKEDPNGHYGLFWGRNGAELSTLQSWNLNEQASVARAYLDSSLAILPGDVNQDGVLNTADVSAFVAGWLSETSSLDYFGKLRAGDLDLSGATTVSDFALFRQAMNDGGVVIPPRVAAALLGVPEPTGGVLAVAGAALVGWVGRGKARRERRG